MDRIRLGEFVKWIGEERETFRSILNRGEAPIAKERGDEKQRTYDGADLMAWCIFTMLRRMGLTPRLAGETVRLSDVVAQFFQAMQKGEDVSDWHVYSYATRRDRGEKGQIEVVWQTFGGPDEAARVLRVEAEGYGKPDLQGYIRLGLVGLTSVPLWPCYERCVATAKAHGFDMQGPDLFEIEG
ncbi:hypothetical protein GEU84_004555 [Fertoebacter nigrum]|uniref:Uncharacterized protein n=1 Tax=Fertoeibacter niger TaxID=2656921 RepID=A0A8X8GV09_9RHOB|nr:hypothetical protein [Fertoeibacter niger]NUB43647.1 hypothetical protein [Fertoeibacter niger]